MISILNEYKYAKKVISEHIMTDKPSEILSILARYYRHKENKSNKEIYDLLDDYMKNYYPNYNKVKWTITLDKQVKDSKKYILTEIDGINITQNEINIIKSVNKPRVERILFALLIFAKYNNLKNSINNNWTNRKFSEIFKLANVNMTQKQQCEVIYELKNLGLINLSKKVDNLNIQVNYIDNNSDIVLHINSFDNLGYEYMFYIKQKGFIRCDDCNKIVKVNNKDTNTTRCKECYDIYRREYKKIKERERRNKCINVDSTN